jgi:hypothetical protein
VAPRYKKVKSFYNGWCSKGGPLTRHVQYGK